MAIVSLDRFGSRRVDLSDVRSFDKNPGISRVASGEIDSSLIVKPSVGNKTFKLNETVRVIGADDLSLAKYINGPFNSFEEKGLYSLVEANGKFYQVPHNLIAGINPEFPQTVNSASQPRVILDVIHETGFNGIAKISEGTTDFTKAAILLGIKPDRVQLSARNSNYTVAALNKLLHAASSASGNQSNVETVKEKVTADLSPEQIKELSEARKALKNK